MTDLQDSARDALRELVTRAGVGALRDPRRLKAMLADALPTYRIELGVLSAAVDEGIVAELVERAAGGSGSTLAQLASRLERARAMSPDAARWSVDAWGSALGIPPEAPVPAAPADPRAPLPETVAGDPALVGEEPRAPQTDAGGPGRTRPWLWPVVGAGGALALVVIAIILGTRNGDPDNSEPPGSSSPGQPGDVITWQELVVGDCHDVASDTLRIQVISCADLHEREVFSVRTFTHATGDPYPADIEAISRSDCQGMDFSEFVGLEYDASRYYVDVLYPSEEGWNLDSRTLVCEIYDPQGPTAGSKEGANE